MESTIKMQLEQDLKALYQGETQERHKQTTLTGEVAQEMPKVMTSDGHLVAWDRNEIIDQLITETKIAYKFHGKEPCDRSTAIEIAKEAEKLIRNMNLEIVAAPLIREVVNTILLKRGYIEWRNVATRVGMPLYDAHQIDTGYGFEAKENSNLIENAETAHKKKADKLSKEQALLQLPPELAKLHISGDLHIHDLEYFTTRPFCQDHDLRVFLYCGLVPDGVGNKTSVAGPAKHPAVAVLHAAKILGSSQTNFSGGQGFYNFITFLAPYFEGLPYKEIKQLAQMFIYEIGEMMVARGSQVVFSSVQLSPGVPKIWRDKPVVARGKIYDGKMAPLRTYGEFERENRLFFKAFMEVMLEGDYWGKPFNFPKPEISIEPDFLIEKEKDEYYGTEIPTYEELYDLAFELAAKFGTPYFDNQVPEYRGAGKGISCYQCCAYNFSSLLEEDREFEDKLYFRNGKHFSMGSWQVVSLNLPRAAYKAEGDDKALIRELKRLMDSAVEIFKIKYIWMKELVEKHRMPFAQQQMIDPNTGAKLPPLVDFNGLVWTIGVVGLNDMVHYHLGKELHESKEALKFGIRVMTELELYAKELSKKHGMKIALARTPAESTAQRFAVSDLLSEEFKEKARNIVKGNVGKAEEIYRCEKTRDLPVYYTNGTHVAPSADISLIDRIKIEHVFFPIVDGGNIFHIWLGESAPDPVGLRRLAWKIIKNTQIGYFAFTKDYTICLNCHSVESGLHDRCERCGSMDVDHYSRITGYYNAVSGWNAGKKQELMDRKRYTIA
jgi:ribonucleoside-triphosphate reductase